MTDTKMRVRSDRRHQVVATVVSVALGVAYATLTLLRFRRFTLSSWDNAIFEQAVRSYAHLGAPVVDIKGPGFNILGDHFSPIDALIAPIYCVFPSAQTILLAQVFLVTVSIWVITSLAVRRLGVLTGTAIGLSFGLQSAVATDFHEVAFGAPLLALAGSAYVDRRFDRVVWWSLPLLLVKEDLGLTVAVIGAVLWWAGERRRGAVLGAVGLSALVLIVLVVVPSFNPGDSYAYASSLGGNRGIVATLFDDPGRKLATVALTVGITGLVALGSPWVLVVLPTFAWRFAGDNPYYWGTSFHYSLLLMPIVFVAMVDVMARWPRARWATLVAVVVTGFTLVSSPLSTLLDSQTYQQSLRAAAAGEVLALVPRGASVETDIGLITHLTTDRTVYWLGTVGSARPTYVLFDLFAGIGSPEDVVQYAEQQHGGTYRLIYDNAGYVLAQRRP